MVTPDGFVSPEHYFEVMAAELDRFTQVPDDVLTEIVTRDGCCMWLWAESPGWTDEYMTDRELAARICAACPVRLACLELELRTAGADTLGVWGALSEQDRRALYPVWRARRQRLAERRAGGEQR